MDEIRISHVEKSYTTLSTDLVIGGAKRPRSATSTRWSM